MRAASAAGEFVWYVIQTKPKQEYRAEHNLCVSEFETFVPTIWERSPLKVGMETGYRFVPLFPGYIFVRFVAEQHLKRIRTTSGVHHVVNFGNGPARVDDDVIALLRARVAGMETRDAAPRLLPGEHMMIKDGPLRNLLGIFERETKGCERVARAAVSDPFPGACGG
jgi:transcriptional antiterminator RfaH